MRVLDFGIAKHLSQTRRFTVNLFGSLPYTPPERLERGVVDRHSDLWAVGVVLYVMATGRPPFPGDSAEELEQRIRAGEPPLPPPESVSPRLRRILETCLAFDVADRYSSAATLRADLEAVLDGRPLAAERAETAAAEGVDPSATRRTRPVAVAAGPEATRRTDVQERSALPPAEATRRTTAEVPAGGEGSGGPVLLGGVPPLPPLPATEPATASAALVEVVAQAEQTALVVQAAQTALVAQAEPAPRRRRLWRRVVVVLLVLIALVSSQIWVAGEAQEIRRQLVTERSPDLDQIWARYRRTARWSLLGTGLGDLREELRDALVRSAERILDSYRGDNPATTERGWQIAERRLQSAAELEGRNRELRARLLYARAHLDRIEAQTLRGKGQRQQADERSNAAIAGFKEAAERDPDWPDPYLGLARIYAYDRFDLGALQAALERAGGPRLRARPPRAGHAGRRPPHARAAAPGGRRRAPRARRGDRPAGDRPRAPEPGGDALPADPHLRRRAPQPRPGREAPGADRGPALGAGGVVRNHSGAAARRSGAAARRSGAAARRSGAAARRSGAAARRSGSAARRSVFHVGVELVSTRAEASSAPTPASRIPISWV